MVAVNVWSPLLRQGVGGRDLRSLRDASSEEVGREEKGGTGTRELKGGNGE